MNVRIYTIMSKICKKKKEKFFKKTQDLSTFALGKITLTLIGLKCKLLCK